ncbi:extracellular matrix protein 2 [Esox lucius]|uniref:extracellular matrix protein 2 n=1 Tax=Esox lucius TaxID=8010 RepID=UPI0014773971|nr:extracellular matrix protein 2 [Esox lucius]
MAVCLGVDTTSIEEPRGNTDHWSDWKPERQRETQTADEEEVHQGKEPAATQPEESREGGGWSEKGPIAETDSETWTIEEEEGVKPGGHDKYHGIEEEEKRMLVGGLDYREGRITEKHEKDERGEAKHNGKEKHEGGFGTEHEGRESVEKKTDGEDEKLSVNQASIEPIAPPSASLYVPFDNVALSPATQHDLTPVTSVNPTQHDRTPVTSVNPTQHDLTPVTSVNPTQHDLTPVTSVNPTQHDLTPVTSVNPTQHDLTPVTSVNPTPHDLTPVTSVNPTPHDLTPVTSVNPTPHDLTPVTSVNPPQLPMSVTQTVTQTSSRSQGVALGTEMLVESELVMVHSATDSSQSHLREEDQLVSLAMKVSVEPTVSVSRNHKQAGAIVASVKETANTFTQLKTTAKPQKAIPKLQRVKTTANKVEPTPRNTTTPSLSAKSATLTVIELQYKETSKPTIKPKVIEQTKPTLKPQTTPKTPHKQLTAKAKRTQSTAKTTVLKYTTTLKQTTEGINRKTRKQHKKNGNHLKNETKVNKHKIMKKKGTESAHFPYFKDNYCPPECACYGRVVQCSDKGVEKVPYGIPYNSRYVLLMNNHINSIQLDLLNEYLFMEFLVLSNNQLTDGSIEGALEGIPALRRLYLDRNLLESVPADLPVSLEELRLDNNRLSVMSEAAWARCPGLLVLSLSNNSLGIGSNPLPAGVLLPLGSLRTLSLDHNRLASVPLGLPLSLRELYLRGNLIREFPGEAFVGTSELTILDLSGNRLTERGLPAESLVNTTHLESLNLEGNRLKHVPRHLPSSLKTLNLEGNLISSVGKSAFLRLPHLEHLGLARNRISRVAPGALRALLDLHQLDLSHNALRQVPRQLPWGLHTVAATHNKIRSVPRDAFCWGGPDLGLSGLVRVQLEHNLIDLGHLDTKAFRCLRGFQVIQFN